MIILGLDPGLARLGYGVVEKRHSQLLYRAAGVITTPAKQPFPERLQTIQRDLRKLLRKYKPDWVGVEQLFFFKNVTTAFSVGQAIGVITLTLAETKLATVELTPLQIKSMLTGYGQANKQQIQKTLQLLFHLDKAPSPDDAADGLACAYCAAQRSPKAILIDQH